MKNKLTKRLMSLALVLLLVLGVLPVTAMASDNVASLTVNGTCTEYASVQAAVDAASVSGGTVKLLADVELTAQVEITSGTVTIDLAGYQLANYTSGENNNVLYVNGGNLTVTDSSSAKTGTLTPNMSSIDNSGVYLESGNATIKGGIFSGALRAVTVVDGTMTIDDITTDEEIRIEGGELIINGGSMEQLDMSGGETIVNGGYFSTTSGTTYLMFLNGGNVTVNGGIWKFCDNYGIRFNSDDSMATIRGGIYTNGFKVSYAYGVGETYIQHVLDTGYNLYDDSGNEIALEYETKKVKGYVVVSNTSPGARVYNVKMTLTGLTCSFTETTLPKGRSIFANFYAEEGYAPPEYISVRMDGKVVSSSKYSYSNGFLQLMSSSITGDIEIVAKAVEKWTYTVTGSAAITDGADNTMTQDGTTYTKTYTAVPVGTEYTLSVTGSSVSSSSQSAAVTFNITSVCDVTVTYDSATGEITVTGDGVEIPKPAALTFYYDNSSTKWSSVYIYAWNDEGAITSAWPGNQMALVSGETDIYYAQVSAETTFVIFNNNAGTQSGDMALSNVTGNMYNHSTGAWSTYVPSGDVPSCSHDSHNTSGNCTFCGTYVGHTYVNGSCVCGATETVTPQPGTRVVYFRNTDGWGQPYIYTWTTANGVTTNYTGAWPGAAMEPVAGVDGLFCYTISTDAVNIIFNNGTGTQTGDLTIPTNGDNLFTYSTKSWSAYACDHSYSSSITTDPTCTDAGVKTYTCSKCGDSYTESVPSLGHSYENGSCTVCGEADPNYNPVVKPAFTVLSKTLNLEGEVKYNMIFMASNTNSVTEMGLITFLSNPSDVSIENADYVIPGAVSASGMYMVGSQGIPAKNLGDTLYMVIYAKLTDGSYAYSSVVPYSAKDYAYAQLGNSGITENQRKLLVAMLNYGAEAQLAFGYNTENLINADLATMEIPEMVTYSNDLLDACISADDAKTGNFPAGGFHMNSATVSLEGALAINYLLMPANTPANGMKVYYWTAETYNSVDALTVENADGTLDSIVSSGMYMATYNGLAASQMGDTVYVAAVYENGGNTYTTGVISYSLAKYLTATADGTGEQKNLAAATVIYGYYANIEFPNV